MRNPHSYLQYYIVTLNVLKDFTTGNARNRSQDIFELFNTLFVPRVHEGPLSFLGFCFMYYIWQDAWIRT